ncbi:MAG: leucine--tRNA ligase [Alphaproteobacteria bacterium]|nr:leucine--tRNA ligase [Alphaproteobacteria bacterium]
MKKQYVLEMFPYPSGNIHMGHVRNYTIGDIYTRYLKLKGHDVIHPMGWDAFGLPAENAAIQNKTHPKKWTYENIANMKKELQSLNLDLDWDREFATCDELYYKHQQGLFVDFYKNGLAYKKDAMVNWDPVDQTVLANEQVIDGKGWRTGADVIKRNLSQWFFKITDYAEELLTSIDHLDGWPEKVKTMQRNWIGKSIGAEIQFQIKGLDKKIEIFTTRPDTIFGATFIALSINHAFARSCFNEDEISDLQKKFADTNEKEKVGVFLDNYCVHPVTGEDIPIYLANFVLDNYGQGAIFGCPAHDERDFEFAEKYSIPVIKVVECDDSELPFTGSGKMINSSFLNGLLQNEAIEKITNYFLEKKIGKKSVNFKLRDWGVSRQRYWGCPIPVIYYEDGSHRVLDHDELPVVLPEQATFTGQGNPLDNTKDWVEIKCKKTGKKAFRETDTLDTFVDSSWYFLRFLDSKNNDQPFDVNKIESFTPVDKYIGGIEHAILHLLYSRFFTKAIRDIYKLKINEPFLELFTQGMITHKTYQNKDKKWLRPNEVAIKNNTLVDLSDGSFVKEGPVEKMSKSKRNTVEPKEILENYGLDATRIFMVSDSPPDRNLEWTEEGIQGSKNLVGRIERYFENDASSSIKDEQRKKIKIFIYNMNENINSFSFNKCIAEIYTLLNFLEKQKIYTGKSDDTKDILACLFPIVPSLVDKILVNIFPKDSIKLQWPLVDISEIEENEINLPIQINGKFVDIYKVNKNYEEKIIINEILLVDKFKQRVKDQPIKKVIHVKDKIINIII